MVALRVPFVIFQGLVCILIGHAHPDDMTFGPSTFVEGELRETGASESVLFQDRESLVGTNFTGYLLGFEYYAVRETLINFQVFRLVRALNISDEQQFGYYTVIAETGFFLTNTGVQLQYLSEPVPYNGQPVVFGLSLQSGNPVPYIINTDGPGVLYGMMSTIGETLLFNNSEPHEYAFRSVLTPSQYASMDCTMHLAPKDDLIFLKSHEDFSVSPYPNLYSRCWVVRPDRPTGRSELQLLHFRLEPSVNSSCLYDSLTISTLKSVSTVDSMIQVRRKLCGEVNSGHENLLNCSPDEYLLLSFSTDHSYTYSGFYLAISSTASPWSFPVAVVVAVCLASLISIVISIAAVIYCRRHKQCMFKKKVPHKVLYFDETYKIPKQYLDTTSDFGRLMSRRHIFPRSANYQSNLQPRYWGNMDKSGRSFPCWSDEHHFSWYTDASAHTGALMHRNEQVVSTNECGNTGVALWANCTDPAYSQFLMPGRHTAGYHRLLWRSIPQVGIDISNKNIPSQIPGCYSGMIRHTIEPAEVFAAASRDHSMNGYGIAGNMLGGQFPWQPTQISSAIYQTKRSGYINDIIL